MASKHDVIMSVLLIAHYRLRQKVIVLCCVLLHNACNDFYFTVLKILVASKILEPTTSINKLIKKKKHYSDVEASRHDYLIITHVMICA